MSSSTGRLRLASDIQSVARLGGGRGPKTLEGPAATEVAVSACETETRDLPTPHSFPTDEGVDMTKSTRGAPRSDSETRTSAVKITPVSSDSAAVPTTSTIA